MRTEPILLTIVLAAACGGAQGKHAPRYADFHCKDRRGSYIATGTLMYQQQGIRLTCDGDVPRVEQFFVTDEGKEQSKKGIISATAWDKAWRDFENAGWRNVHDCENPGAGDRDPIYNFEISDGDHTSTFSCQGAALPFPYDTIQNALDAAAGELPVDQSAD